MNTEPRVITAKCAVEAWKEAAKFLVEEGNPVHPLGIVACIRVERRRFDRMARPRLLQHWQAPALVVARPQFMAAPNGRKLVVSTATENFTYFLRSRILRFTKWVLVVMGSSPVASIITGWDS